MQVQGVESKNLSSITWDHAVNSQQLLTEALKSTYYFSYLTSSKYRRFDYLNNLELIDCCVTITHITNLTLECELITF